MKRLELFSFLFFCGVIAFGSQASAGEKQKKYKVVEVSFSEADTKSAHRGPASLEEKATMEAATRLDERVQVAANGDIPELN